MKSSDGVGTLSSQLSNFFLYNGNLVRLSYILEKEQVKEEVQLQDYLRSPSEIPLRAKMIGSGPSEKSSWGESISEKFMQGRTKKIVTEVTENVPVLVLC